MKRTFALMAALCLAFSAMAQDFSEAVETFNSAAQAESKTDALELFKKAYAQFQACEEPEAADKVEELKNILPNYTLAIAKEKLNAKDYEGALSFLKETADYGTEFGLEDKVADANKFSGMAYKQMAKAALNNKDAASAFASLKNCVECTPEDGEAQFLLGRILLSSGKLDEAKAAFEVAAANGREADVKKQLFNFYYTNGQKKQQAKQHAAAIDDYNAAVEAFPESEKAGQLYYKMGLCYGALGKKAEQNTALVKACELDAATAANENILATIAQNAKALGDKETAKAFYGKLTGSATFGKEAKEYLGK